MHKYFFNRGVRPPLYFWRDKQGHEIDVIVEYADRSVPIEIKSGQTIDSAYFDELCYWNKLAETESSKNIVIYGGDENQTRATGRVISWRSFTEPDKWF
jgi:uncharacterized protein